MNLSDLKKTNPKAYERYVEMLVEDCRDVFVSARGGTLAVGCADGTVMQWNPQATDMSVGSGWERLTGPGLAKCKAKIRRTQLEEEPLG